MGKGKEREEKRRERKGREEKVGMGGERICRTNVELLPTRLVSTAFAGQILSVTGSEDRIIQGLP